MRFRFSFLFDDRNNRTARTHTEESSTNLSIVGRGDFTKKRGKESRQIFLYDKKKHMYKCLKPKNNHTENKRRTYCIETKKKQ